MSYSQKECINALFQLDVVALWFLIFLQYTFVIRNKPKQPTLSSLDAQSITEDYSFMAICHSHAEH